MDLNTISREAVRLGIQVGALLLAYALAAGTGLHQFTGPETEGLNTLIVVVGSVYAVILAFVIYVIWGQFTEVENCVMRECTSLGDLLRFSNFVPADFSRSIRKDIEAYAQQVLKHEWQALGDGRKDKRAEELFSQLVETVITGVQAASQGDPIHGQLVEIARMAGERRAERLTKSLTRIPPSMYWFVNMISAALVLLVFAYPFHHIGAGMISLGLVAVLLLLANFVMRDMDNPISGAWNVSPKAFSELRA